MTRFFGKDSAGYDEIVRIFQSNDIPALNAFVQSATCVELLEKDKNYGLALQGILMIINQYSIFVTDHEKFQWQIHWCYIV